MATTAVVKANPFFSSKQSQNLHVKLCCVNSLKYGRRSKFAGVKVRRSIMVNCTTSISTRNNDMADMITNNSKELEKYPFENFAFDAIISTLKWLKITAVVTASSLLLWMMMYGHESALALSGGAMGGHSISSKSSSNRSSFCHRPCFSVEEPVVKEETMVYKIAGILSTLTGSLIVPVAIVRGITRDPIGIFRIQVGLLVNGKSLQRDLDEIAKISDTSNPSSWNLILKDTIKSLYRHRDNWKYADSYVIGAYRCVAERYFEELTLEERNKFDEVTLDNLNNIKTSITSQEEEVDRSINTYIVVTIFVAIDAKHEEKLSDTMSSRADVDLAFKELQSHDSANIKGVHVLWGPQRTNEVMSLEELKKLYPLLTPLKK
ncbi:hypothetical protein Dsin_022536 [Dipteronia sinensis]|uniref:Uncharacterized protein n=1 Tax=Dipteronia sinensis TaxID=43782 RepID=A0AAE0E013_9ROSI|nr:hypothetical protein Dsin_022536 [Dipteronia sinensis]